MTKYEVWSQGEFYTRHSKVLDADVPVADTQLEVTRTDRKTAEADAEILRAVTGRKAWVVEVSGG